jgi:hypothetical protein
MSLLTEINYSDYIADQIKNEDKKYIEGNMREYKYWKESMDPLSHANFLPKDEALQKINRLYEKNIFYLQKEPWAKLLIERIRKDIKRGFCRLMVIDPSYFIMFMKMIRPLLSLFSKAHIFTQTLNDLDKFYNTTIGGCYIPDINRMYITYRYIEKSLFDLDTFKILLHEYCHYYSYRKHKEYMELFKEMCLTFYTTLVENICNATDIEFSKETRIKLIATILDGVFNYRINGNRINRMLGRLYDISEVFATIYYNLIISRSRYITDNKYFNLAQELLQKAYRAIGNDQISDHVSKFIFTFQEFYVADEVVAVMSYYKPNTKPYLEMLRRM